MTMFVQRCLNYLLFIFILSCFFTSCKQQEDKQELHQDLIYSHTSGLISRTEGFTIYFTQAQEHKFIPEDCISISPSVQGQYQWVNTKTLEFVPDEMWGPGITIEVELAMKCIAEERDSYKFTLETIQPSAKLSITNIRSVEDGKQMYIEGVIRTSDYVDSERIEGNFRHSYVDGQISVEWLHNPDGRSHQFRILNIERGDESSVLEIFFKSLDDDPRILKEQVRLPAIGVFELLDFKVYNSGQQRIEIFFSNTLDQNQDLTGLVVLEEDTKLKTDISGNVLTLYPSNRLESTHDIKLNEQIRDGGGETLANRISITAEFRKINPQVRWVGKGFILPEKGKRYLPFEAVSLNAVDVEILKMDQNNLNFQLLTSNMEDEYSFNRNGDIIFQKKIKLNELSTGPEMESWNRYALDLGEIINVDAGALYQLRLGFRPSYATLECVPEVDESLSKRYVHGGYWEKPSIMSVGYRGYADGPINWANRDNPCKASYYNDSRFISKNTYATNIGLMAKEGEDRSLLIYAVDLMTTQPLENVQIILFDEHNHEIEEGTTDENGQLWMKGLSANPEYLNAEKNGSYAYLKVNDGAALSMSQFNTSGQFVPGGLKTYLFAERGVWRPGDSIFLNAIVYNELQPLPEDYPIRMKVYDAQGKLYTNKVIKSHLNHFYPLHFATHPNDPTGTWRAVVEVGGSTQSITLPVETIKPNRILVDGSSSLLNEQFSFTGQAQWLQGNPAKNLKTESQLLMKTAQVRFEAFPDYTFMDPARQLSSERKTVFEGNTDQSGKFSFNYPLPNPQQLPGDVEFQVKTQVFEPAGGFSTDIYTSKEQIFSAYVGVRTPQTEYGYPVVKLDQSSDFDIVCLDKKGQPLSDQKISVGFYKLDWSYWWDSNRGNFTRYNSAQHQEAIEVKEVITDERGRATVSFIPDAYGLHLVRACHSEGHCGGAKFYGGYWGATQDDVSGLVEMPLKIEKEEYLVGEEMSLSFPGIENSRVLISLENGTKVLSNEWIKGSSGKQNYNLSITEDMSPGFYIHITQLQGVLNKNNDLPLRRYAVKYINVRSQEKVLEPEISMADQLEPGQEFEVTIEEQSGKPMTYVLMVVDEGLLSLTNFDTPDPYQSMYAKEQLGVRTFDFFDDILLEYSSEIDRLLAVGGDGYLDPPASDVDRFKPVVLFEGPYELSKDKKHTHSLKMPNYFGRVRVMAVAAQNGRFGAAEKDVPVKKELMITATLPRKLGVGEEVVLPVTLFADQAFPNGVNVSLDLEGPATFVGPSSQNIEIPDPGNYLAYFRIKVGEETDSVYVTSKASSGRFQSSYNFHIEVINNHPELTSETAAFISQNEVFHCQSDVEGELREMSLEVSSLFPFSTNDKLEKLIRYPYGCLEQTTSAAFPQLYVSSFQKLEQKEKSKIDRNINAALDKIRRFQNGNGGFGMWPSSRTSNSWISSYVGHFLLEAEQRGYPVLSEMKNSWVDYQLNLSRSWDERYWKNTGSIPPVDHAYRLFTLALAGKADLASMNRFRGYTKMSSTTAYLLAAAYQLGGMDKAATELYENAKNSPSVPEEFHYYTMGSDIRNQCLVLYAFSKTGKKDQADELAESLSKDIREANYLSTQSTAFALIGFSEYLNDKMNGAKPALSYALQTGSEEERSIRSDEFVKKHSWNPPNMPTVVKVRNQKDVKLLSSCFKVYQPTELITRDESRQLKMEVTYKDMNGRAISIDLLEQGTNFKMFITISRTDRGTRTLNNVALRIPLPLGWEVANQRLENGSNALQGLDYLDIRDEAVHAFFSLSHDKTKTMEFSMTASYAGTFKYFPLVCEAMYDHSFYCAKGGQKVIVEAAND